MPEPLPRPPSDSGSRSAANRRGTARAPAFHRARSMLDDGIALLAEMVRDPRLDEGEFERLKAERLADILQARADPGRLADEMFLRQLYAADTPYGRLSAGTPETVGALDLSATCATFHAAARRRDVAHLIIAGADRAGRCAAGRRAPSRRLERHGPGPPDVRAGAARRPAGRARRPARIGPIRAAGRAPRASTAPTRATSRRWCWRRSWAASSAAA